MKRIVALVIIILVAIIGGGLWWYYAPTQTAPTTSGIFASGFIEARDVSIATEISGRIVSIAADEGNEVKAGATLIKLDDSLLKAQLKQAETTIKLAQSGVEQALASRDKAIVARDGAKKNWENALDIQNNPLELDAKIISAKGELQMAEVNLQRLDFQISATRPEVQPSYWAWDKRSAKIRYDTAVAALKNLEEIRSNPQEIAASVDKAHGVYLEAIAAIDVASKAVETAQKQVEQARASLDVIQVQIGKTVVSSPISGMVTARNAEPGELSQPGAPILTITELAEVTLTAYVAESKIGHVRLGQEATVSVDSYPGQDFTGKVIFISPKAQFTPKNIQMKEEREKTVFAVKIRLSNPEQKLKAGMPADAHILANVNTP